MKVKVRVRVRVRVRIGIKIRIKIGRNGAHREHWPVGRVWVMAGRYMQRYRVIAPSNAMACKTCIDRKRLLTPSIPVWFDCRSLS